MNEEVKTNYLVGVVFDQLGKSVYFLTEDDSLLLNDTVICETTRGIELGKVSILPVLYDGENKTELFPLILRRATESDLAQHAQNLEKSKEAVSKTQEEANKLDLKMNIISADYMLDGTKVVISYLAEERVDFRDLLKVLASIFHCRIELRQIGTRDKAKMIGGIGICGLKLCCSSFLNEFDGISITMAKNQMLALNIPKLSGHCGKLICCLKYEDSTYADLKKNMPRVGLKVKYNNDIYKITSMNVLTSMIRIENSQSILTLPLQELEGKILPKEPVANETNKKL